MLLTQSLIKNKFEYLPIALILLAFLSCNSNFDQNDLSLNNLKGKVHILTETSFDTKERFGRFEQGNMTRVEVKKFDNIGNLLEFTLYYPNGEQWSKESYEYNDFGKIAKNNNYTGEKLIQTLIYVYNSSKELIEIDRYDERDGKELYMRHFYKYDEKGNRSEENTYMENGEFNGYVKYRYDEKNRNIEEINSNLESIIKRAYDENGYLIQTEEYYIANGELKNPVLERRELLNYDENGNCTKSVLSDFSQTDSFFYKYQNIDKNGNWLKKLEYRNNKPVEVIERLIEYY